MTTPGIRIESTILLVEDDRGIAGALTECLNDRGYHTLLAQHGQAALDLLQRNSVDVIVLDLRLPVMNGWRFRAMQRKDPRLARVPVIAMSADTSAAAEAIDAQAFIKKPFKADELVVIIERVLREEQQLAEAERLTTLGTLAASIGHEINNPLTYILGNVEMMEARLAEAREPDQAPDLDGGQRELMRDLADLLRDVRVGAERIHAVMADLRTLSRREPTPSDWLNINQVIETSIALCWHEIRHRARLSKRLGALPPVFGNAARLGQVFVNLLANAAQAIPPGAYDDNEIVVTTSAAGGPVAIEVSDTGVGMPAELRTRVFDPFFTTKHEFQGTGIGLTISRNIVLEHGGHIEVLSAPGAGTTFRVVLPASDGGATVEPATRCGSRPCRTPGVEPLRLLVVDDDPLVLATLRRTLAADHAVTTASGAAEALRLLGGGGDFDAILCDVMMPSMSGMEFAAEVERRWRGLRARIIFVTGGSLVPEVQAFRRLTSNPWLEKPFHTDALMRSIHEVAAQPRN
jgi:signal transduction histidine kinase